MFAQVSQSTTPGARIAAQPERMTLIALKSNDIFGVTSYRIEDGRLNYVLLGGTAGSAEVAEVDWTKTSQINTARVTTGTFESRVY
jgi:hypothetical protein